MTMSLPVIIVLLLLAFALGIVGGYAVALRVRKKAQATAAELASKAKGEFLLTMSHQIRTPLNGLLGMADLLNSTPLNHEQRSIMNDLLVAGGILSSSIGDILDLAKIESGGLVVEKSSFSLASLMEGVSIVTSHQASRKGLEFTHHIDERCPPFLTGDMIRIRHILLQFLDNAVKFTKKGRVSIEVYSQEVTSPEPDPSGYGVSNLVFITKDTGSGLPREVFDFLNTPGAASTSPGVVNVSRLGLGLTLAKRILSLMGAQLSAQTSEAGTSITISIILPIASPPPPPQASLATRLIETKWSTPPKVLVAEDNDINSKLVHMKLKAIGCNTTIVGNGRKAVDICEKNRFDLIFMDLQMPLLDGLDAALEIRSPRGDAGVPLNLKTPIVALTAHSSIEERGKCLKSGMDGYITKPFKTHELLEALRNHLPHLIVHPVKRTIPSPPADSGHPPSEDQPIFDSKAMLENFDNDIATFESVAGLFLGQLPEQLKGMLSAIETTDAKAFKDIAHTLKGLAAQLGSERLRQTALAAEDSARSEDWKSMRARLTELTEGFDKLERHLRANYKI